MTLARRFRSFVRSFPSDRAANLGHGARYADYSRFHAFHTAVGSFLSIKPKTPNFRHARFCQPRTCICSIGFRFELSLVAVSFGGFSRSRRRSRNNEKLVQTNRSFVANESSISRNPRQLGLTGARFNTDTRRISSCVTR